MKNKDAMEVDQDSSWKARLVAELVCPYVRDGRDMEDNVNFAHGVKSFNPDLSDLFRDIVQFDMANYIENKVREWSHFPSDEPSPRRHMQYGHFCASIWKPVVQEVESRYDKKQMSLQSSEDELTIQFKDLHYHEQLQIILENITEEGQNEWVEDLWEDFLHECLEDYRAMRFEEELEMSNDMFDEEEEDFDFDTYHEMMADASFDAAQEASDDLARDIRQVWMSVCNYFLGVVKSSTKAQHKARRAAEKVFKAQRRDDAEYFVTLPHDLFQHQRYYEWVSKGTMFGDAVPLEDITMIMDLSFLARENGYESAFTKKVAQLQVKAEEHPEEFESTTLRYLDYPLKNILKKKSFLPPDLVIVQIAEDCMVDAIMNAVGKNQKNEKKGLDAVPPAAFPMLAKRLDLSEAEGLCPCCIQQELEEKLGKELEKDSEEVKTVLEERMVNYFIDAWKKGDWRYINV